MIRQTALLALTGAALTAHAMEPTRFANYTDGFQATGSQVADWIKTRAATRLDAHTATRESLADAQAVAAYQDKVRDAFLRSIGGLPERNASLDVVETGRLERDGYHIRKLIHQSLPGVYVTSNLYVPAALAEKPAPAIFVGCGHAIDGKAAPAYQRVCIDLVRAGFVVLIMDSPSQGEQIQCLDPETQKPVVGTNTTEHSFLQLGASLLNHNVARYFIANAQSAIDLLAGLPEVDASRIGVTGNSGGGTLTQYLMIVDPRVRAAMPACSVTTRAGYLATGSRVYDGEQNLFGAISTPLDYADLLASIAPRPLRVGAAEYDYFAIEGVTEAVESVKAVYRAAGAPDAVDLVVAPAQLHGYSTPLRRAAVEFFARHLQGREVAPFTDEPGIETPQTLQCTRGGQVLTEFADARSILDLFRDEWTATRANAPALTRETLKQKLLPAPQPPQPLRVRRTGTHHSPAGLAERIFFFSEPGVTVTAAIYNPPPSVTINKAVLLLIPDGTEGQTPFAADIAERVARGELVMVFDTRGTGAVRMHNHTGGQGLAFRSPEFRSAGDHFMLGTSLAARRTHDVLRALEYLRGRLDAADTRVPLTISGHGWPAIYGLLAAAVDGNVETPAFSGLPGSWAEAFELRPDRPERISPSLIAPELGGVFDIDDLLRLAGGRRL